MLDGSLELLSTFDYGRLLFKGETPPLMISVSGITGRTGNPRVRAFINGLCPCLPLISLIPAQTSSAQNGNTSWHLQVFSLGHDGHQRTDQTRDNLRKTSLPGWLFGHDFFQAQPLLSELQIDCWQHDIISVDETITIFLK